MHQGIRGPAGRQLLSLLAVLASLAVAACGSEQQLTPAGMPPTLLKQTFSGSHKVSSGDLNFA